MWCFLGVFSMANCLFNWWPNIVYIDLLDWSHEIRPNTTEFKNLNKNCHFPTRNLVPILRIIHINIEDRSISKSNNIFGILREQYIDIVSI